MAFMEEKAANNAPRNGSHKAQIFGNLLRDFLEARGTSCSDFGFVHNKKRVTMDIYIYISVHLNFVMFGGLIYVRVHLNFSTFEPCIH